MKRKLWPADTFVDFDDGLNTAVRKIRDALGDSAEKPRYIETIPRRGYRFVGRLADVASAILPSPVEGSKGSVEPEKTNVASSYATVAKKTFFSRHRRVLLAAVVVLAAISVALASTAAVSRAQSNRLSGR